MKWVALAIVAFIGSYTAVTLYYRRPTPAYQPFHDSKERVMVTRLRDAGYQRITAVTERPADPQRPPGAMAGPLTETADDAGGVPDELKELFIDQPRLPASFNQVRVPGEANQLLPYVLRFTCALPNHNQLLSETYVYVKDQEIAIVPDFEALDGDLLTRTPESTVQLTIPSGVLRAGSYQVRLIGRQQSKRWTLQVH